MTLGPLTFWPAAFWLLPPVLAVLIWLRYFRTRRQEILAGSLLLWRRLAAQTPKAPPRRFIIDRTLILQFLALLALIAALSAPQWSLNQNRGRAMLLVVDNGPLARANADGKALFADVVESGSAVLHRLDASDTVFLARTAPLPKLLSSQALSPSAALEMLRTQKAALSGPDANAVWLFAADTARSLGKDNPISFAVVSLQEKAAPDSSGRQWLCAAPKNASIANVGIIDFGATPVTQNNQPATQVLARLKNSSVQSIDGTVAIESADGTELSPKQRFSLGPQSEQAAVFTLTNLDKPIRIAWTRTDGKSDSLPDDDVIVAAPRPLRIPRVRFHAPVSALEKLYRAALNATFVASDDAAGADLEIYAGSTPDKIPAASKAFLLLAPEAGYHSYFDVGDKTLSWPKAQLDESSPLTRGMGNKTESLFAVPKALELLRTGDFKSVVKDAKSDRALVAQFIDEQQRPAFVLAFVPGAGLPPDRLLEPELAAILVRIALQASGSGDPFEVTRASMLELASGEPLAADWQASFKNGAGVLNETVSALNLGKSTGETFDVSALHSLEVERSTDLRPWLIVVALALLAWESFGLRPVAQPQRTEVGA